jgi:hypothetical protein
MSELRIFGRAPRANDPDQAFLEQIGPELVAFAQRHSLSIWRYPADHPMWSFNFLHPKDGFGVITLFTDTPVDIHHPILVCVTGDWFLDRRDPDRRLGSEIRCQREVGANVQSVIDALESVLAEVVAWPRSVLVTTSLHPLFGEPLSDFERSLTLPT